MRRYQLAWLSIVYLLFFYVPALAGLFSRNGGGGADTSEFERGVVPAADYEYDHDYDQDYDYHSQELVYEARKPVPGLSLQTAKRRLSSWQLAEFILIGSVDGSLHARDRTTGFELWTIPGEGPLVQVSGEFNDTDEANSLTWIVEPMGDGSLYFFTEGTGLRKMPVSIKQLVAESPFSVNGDDKVYTGNRHTTLYSINATTGEILRVFGGELNSLGKPECKARLDGDLDFEDFDEESSAVDNGSFMIGKTDYNLAIYGNSGTIWNVTFSSWGPNNMDADLAEQHIQSIDSLYVTPVHNNSILALSVDKKAAAKPARWVGKIPSRAVEVFDVLRSPLRNPNDPLVLLHQPEYPFLDGTEYAGTYVERTKDGQWYALSGENFPALVNDAPMAKWCDLKLKGKPTGRLEKEALWEALVGVHPDNMFNTPQTTRQARKATGLPPGLDGSAPILGIDPAPAHDYRKNTYYQPAAPLRRGNQVSQPSPKPLTPPPLPTGPSAILSSWWNFITRVFENVVTFVFLFGVAALMSRFGWFPQMADFVNAVLASLNHSIQTQKPKQLQEQQKETQRQIEDEKPVVDDAEITVEGDNTVVVNVPEKSQQNNASEESEQKNAQEDGVVEKKVSIVEPPSNERPPKEEKTEKKKRKRGSRGGRKNNLAAKREREREQKQQEDDEKPDNLRNAEIVSKDGEKILDENMSMEDSTGALTVDFTKELGKGSHGTIVFRGEFENRPVAVKRMILNFYDLASQEVNLLQESDDHRNVIRYICKHQTEQFLYIALELCQGTLEDLIENDSRRPNDRKFESEYLANLDKKDLLKQIAEGLNYLHSLKIVHRDIKPQNILVAAPKKVHRKVENVNQQIYSPIRMVISDFGLCKKLEEEQSSFRPTTAQAAGTVGWIAPEVDRKTWSRPDQSGLDSSSDLISNGMDKSRRLTRAVDIFSLGCVFYYVLTRGDHPFGPIPKRESNISEGKFDLQGLDSLENLYDYSESYDLILKMIQRDPRLRPDANGVLQHPYFWTPKSRLELIYKVSDWCETVGRERPQITEILEEQSRANNISNPELVGENNEIGWRRNFSKEFLDHLRSHRTYQGDSVTDFLRAIRNKASHYNELPHSLKIQMPMHHGYLNYFTERHPLLFITVYYFALENLLEEEPIRTHFEQEQQLSY